MRAMRAHDGARTVSGRPLTVKAAAARVKRSRSTIERWIADGLLDVTVVKDAKGNVIRRYLRLDQLLAVYRQKILANPTRPSTAHDDTPS